MARVTRIVLWLLAGPVCAPNKPHKESPAFAGLSVYNSSYKRRYIMPPIPPIPPIPPSMPPGIGGAGLSSGASLTIASVVIIRPEIEAACCHAPRVTMVGSRIPISIMSPYSPVPALYP